MQVPPDVSGFGLAEVYSVTCARQCLPNRM
jgi:hypothetical protein